VKPQVEKPAALETPRARRTSPRESRAMVKVGEDFYVLASSLASRRTTCVLANAQSFTIFDAGGDIIESPLEALGFFRRDTRYLSHFELDIDGKSPYFLNSYISDDKAELRVNLTNPDLGIHGDVIELPRDSIQIQRSWVLAADADVEAHHHLS
jgi:glycogen debranching enzyme